MDFVAESLSVEEVQFGSPEKEKVPKAHVPFVDWKDIDGKTKDVRVRRCMSLIEGRSCSSSFFLYSLRK